MVWRYILAFALSIAVIAGWQYLFPPPERPATPDPAALDPLARPDAAQPRGRDGEPPPPGDRERDRETVDPTRPVRPRKEVPLALTRGQLSANGDSEDVRLSLVTNSLGGTISAVFLPEYKDKDDRNLPYQLLDAAAPPRQFLRLDLVDHANIPPGENWEIESVPDERGAPGVRFTNRIDGLAITKSIIPGSKIPAAKLQPDKLPAEGLHHVITSVEFRNESDRPKTFSYTLYGPHGIDTAATRGGPGTDIHFAAAVWTQQGQRVSPQESVVATNVADRRNLPDAAWVGVANNYFTSIFFPYREEPGASPHVARGFANAYLDPGRVEELQKAGESKEDAYKNILTGFDSREITLAPGESAVHRYGLFLGPRTSEALEVYAPLGFESVNDYFFLVSFFLWLLGSLKSLAFGSWGSAIVLMTVLVKVCLHPFNKKSQGNMHRFQKQMAKVKPEMDEIKQRYKDNRLKQNQEMQRLFKERGINPGQQMGGCLLILMQLPIWFALYSTLGYSLGLRQAPFLWIEDLTQPDRLFPLGIEAFGGMFMYFNILPILYVIFTIVNQRLQPKPEDPQMRSQYQMMTFMMVFFGFIFYNFPAGFMLYIMTSTLLGIFESKLIKAELAHEEAAAAPGAGSVGGVQVAAAGPMYGGKGSGGVGPSGVRGGRKRSGKKRKR